MMNVLAIDGGGTSTVAVISDEFGNVYAKVVAPRSNPTAIERHEFEKTMYGLLQNLRSQNEEALASVQICFAGMAGVKEKNYESIVEAIVQDYIKKGIPIVIENDALIALYAGTLGQEGIVQIAGTGAITMGYDQHHSYVRVGGWGYLFDDEGSGYDLGVRALQAVFQAYDGRAANTLLTNYLLQHFKVENVPQIIDNIYSNEHPRVIISPLSVYVIRAVEKGDKVAKDILNDVCHKFFYSIKACYRRMFWERGTIPVVLAGGVLSNVSLFTQELKQLVKDEGLPFEVKSVRLEPIGGAVIGGLNALGVLLHEDFVDSFVQNYLIEV
ncbi:N-acetylglucosamine kinase [Bacillus sp. FJAT-22090]|uniref:N-acetylglucosamine kinase n=1 Tax=Bacillus sp. FJAT-22090 TaxID=1581038 RepID=UPI0021B4CA3F|nr:BadF/BadG/BcrA/BcrD ATPase family protein [Bacillus sp. FJAT-22090]